MRIITCVLFILMSAGTTACSGADSNPLIGKWRAAPLPDGKPAPNYCEVSMEFTAKTVTTIDSKGASLTVNVRYNSANGNVFPTVVFVFTNAGVSNAVNYSFKNKNEMHRDAVWPCYFVRQ